MEWQELSFSTLRVVSLPFLWLFAAIIYVLQWILSPFVWLAYLLKEFVAWPIRMIAYFEALWYFLACGIVVGIWFGGGAYGVLRLFAQVFNLDREPVPKPIPAKGHDAASYRAARAEKKLKEQEKNDRHAMRVKLLASQSLIRDVVREARSRPVTLTSPLSPNTSTAATRSGLFQDIILEQTDEEEEEDSDF